MAALVWVSGIELGLSGLAARESPLRSQPLRFYKCDIRVGGGVGEATFPHLPRWPVVAECGSRAVSAWLGGWEQAGKGVGMDHGR